jgi:hypothetical protein
LETLGGGEVLGFFVGETVIEAGEETGFDGVLRDFGSVICVHLENAFLGTGWQTRRTGLAGRPAQMLDPEGKKYSADL